MNRCGEIVVWGSNPKEVKNKETLKLLMYRKKNSRKSQPRMWREDYEMNSKIKSKMEKGKKYIIVLLTLLLVSASFNICYAETESKEEKMNEPRISERELIAVPSFIQDNDSYCGPASLEMT